MFREGMTSEEMRNEIALLEARLTFLRLELEFAEGGTGEIPVAVRPH